MMAFYVLAAVTATALSAVGCLAPALVMAGVALVLIFAVELRAGLRKIRRPAKKHVVVPERV